MVLGVISRDGLADGLPNPKAARGYFADAGRFGYAPGTTQLALMKIQGLGGPKDPLGAVVDLRKAGRSDDPEAWEHVAALAREQPFLFDQRAEHYEKLAGAARKKVAARQSSSLSDLAEAPSESWPNSCYAI